MKKTKEMFAGGFYLLQGQSSANSSFIEDKEEALRFISECNKRLMGIAKTHEYLLTKDGWMLLISLQDEKTIKSSYKSRWKKSLRVKKECYLTEVWKIVSEQIRQIRFTFVLYSNRKNGREGSKVKCSYERFWFENLEEAKEKIEKMRKQLLDLSQKKKTYHSKKVHFRIPVEEGKGAIFLCSLEDVTDAESSGIWRFWPVFRLKNDDVLRKLVKKTIELHNTSTFTHLHPQLE